MAEESWSNSPPSAKRMVEASWSNSPPSAKRMAEASWSNSPPSAKHHHGEASGKEPLVVDDDSPVPGQKRVYTVPLKVGIHLMEPLDVVCTSNPDEADKMISKILKRVYGLYLSTSTLMSSIPGKTKPPQRAAVLQLCVEELCLVYHITAATKW